VSADAAVRRLLRAPEARYLADETQTRAFRGRADWVALPESTEDVALLLRWCGEHDVPVVPRGGGTGFAGGCVPLDGGVVLSLERLDRVRSFDPLLWRMHVEAGVVTAEVRRRARETGLLFPPDPGAAESSQIGGNIATNAGGPHAFKYGVTGHWVTGLEAVLPDGEILRLGGSVRKDVAGYDVKSLLIGSEGTLAVLTAAWLRLLPAPEAALPVAAFYTSARDGCAAIEAILGNGLVPAAIEFVDAGALGASASTFPAEVPAGAAFLVLTEADGSTAEAEALRAQLLEVLAGTAVGTWAPAPERVPELWAWRDGMTAAVTTVRGGKVSEDIVVPLDRLADAVERTVAIGERHGLAACSWGHAGDGNLHSTFLVDPTAPDELERAEAAARELFALALELGGSVSGEHGVGVSKLGQLERQWGPRGVALARDVKRAFDPKGLLNPGKKV
jgi:glycolate oxidase subunit GlcD